MFKNYCRSAMLSAAHAEEIDTDTAALVPANECTVAVLQTNCTSQSGEIVRKHQPDFSGASLIYAEITKVSLSDIEEGSGQEIAYYSKGTMDNAGPSKLHVQLKGCRGHVHYSCGSHHHNAAYIITQHVTFDLQNGRQCLYHVGPEMHYTKYM